MNLNLLEIIERTEMKKLPEKLTELLSEVKLTAVHRLGTATERPPVLHKALEKIAINKGITFDDYESNRKYKEKLRCNKRERPLRRSY